MKHLRELTNKSLNEPKHDIYGKGEAEMTSITAPTQPNSGVMAAARTPPAQAPPAQATNPWARARAKATAKRAPRRTVVAQADPETERPSRPRGRPRTRGIIQP